MSSSVSNNNKSILSGLFDYEPDWEEESVAKVEPSPDAVACAGGAFSDMVVEYLDVRLIDSIPVGYEVPNLKQFKNKDLEEPIYGLARPGFPESIGNVKYTLKVLYDLGIEVIISLSNERMSKERDPLIRGMWEASGHLFYHIQTEDHVGAEKGTLNPDYRPPGDLQIEQFMKVLRVSLAARKTIAVYCGEGLGRTGFYMAARFLIEHPGADVDDAKSYLMECYHPRAVKEIEANGSDRKLAELVVDPDLSVSFDDEA